LTFEAIWHPPVVVTGRSAKQRLASSRNAGKAAAARRDIAAARRAGLDAETEAAYAPALAEIEAAIASPKTAGGHARRALLELARIAASARFDGARHRAIRDSLEAAFGRALSDHVVTG
jgi:hypothetical protein